MPQWMPLAASTALSVIPVVIWLIFLSKEGGDRKSIYIKTFLIGTFSVVPPFILMFLFSWKPELDIYSLINKTVEQVVLNAVITNVVVAVIEELGKNMIVRFVDKRHPEFLQTIGSALKLSICAALGFLSLKIFLFLQHLDKPDVRNCRSFLKLYIQIVIHNVHAYSGFKHIRLLLRTRKIRGRYFGACAL